MSSHYALAKQKTIQGSSFSLVTVIRYLWNFSYFLVFLAWELGPDPPPPFAKAMPLAAAFFIDCSLALIDFSLKSMFLVLSSLVSSLPSSFLPYSLSLRFLLASCYSSLRTLVTLSSKKLPCSSLIRCILSL